MATTGSWDSTARFFLPLALCAAIAISTMAAVGTISLVWPSVFLSVLVAWAVALGRYIVLRAEVTWAAIGTSAGIVGAVLVLGQPELLSPQDPPHVGTIVLLVVVGALAGTTVVWSPLLTMAGRDLSIWLTRHCLAGEDRFTRPADQIIDQVPLPPVVKGLMVGASVALAGAYLVGAFFSDWFVTLLPLPVMFVVVTYRAVVRNESLVGDAGAILVGVAFAAVTFAVTGDSFSDGGLTTVGAGVGTFLAVVGALASWRYGRSAPAQTGRARPPRGRLGGSGFSPPAPPPPSARSSARP